MTPPYAVRLSHVCTAYLRRLTPAARRRIVARLEEIAAAPFDLGHAPTYNVVMTLTFQHLAPDPHGEMDIAGRRLRVYTIAGEYEMGMSAEMIADEFEWMNALPDERLRQAAQHGLETLKRDRAEAVRKAMEARRSTLVP